MEYGGMVHALEEIRRLLKPSGVLIDIHPVSVSSPVEIHQGGQIDRVGEWLVRQWCIDYQEADSAISEVIGRGLFVIEQAKVFDSLTHYDSAAEMRTVMKESIAKFARDAGSAEEPVPQAEALADQAEELMQVPGGGAEVIVREPTHIKRLRPT
jgi:hypothetical protein